VRYLDVNGARLSAIGLGTWQFGSKDWGYGDEYAQTEAGHIVDRALELGVNVIDTAEIYGRYESERIVGRAIAGARDRVFLATKVFPVTPFAHVIEKHGRHSAERLGVDQIDLYQIHWPNPLFPLGEQMKGMRRLLDAGVIARAGVSNFSLDKWKAAERSLQAPVFSNQVNYSLAFRKHDAEMVPYAARNDRLVIAYSPLAKGLLSGKYDTSNLPKNPSRLNDSIFLPDNVARVSELIETLRSIGTAHDATPSQVALAWVISHPNVVAIPGASSVGQLEANVAAADLRLTDSEIARLDGASARYHPDRGAKGLAKVAVHRIKH
jgi:aryl-alcohol dehydrogenase-like predicted oxidoreductase